MKKRIIIVIGTRPEGIKLAPIFLELEKYSQAFETHLLVTGQHREMLDQVLAFFNLVPTIDLNLMKSNQTLSHVLKEVIIGVDQAINKLNPDLIIVQGDTTSTLGASLAGYYNRVAVAHVEAGLRTNNLLAPYPEEGNRQLVSRVSDYHFAPTVLNKENLMKEGVIEDKIFVTGNSVIDALFWTKEKLSGGYNHKKHFKNPEILKIAEQNKFVLITGHRRENFGDGFRNVCFALKKLAESHPDFHFIYPVHLNPNVREPVFSILSGRDNFHLIDPVDYPGFVYLMDKSYLVMSDSGGVQEEAPSLGKPVVVMRDVTERQEAEIAGTIKLVGTNYNKIVTETENLMVNKEAYKEMASRENPYGKGNTAKQIMQILKEKL